MEEFKQALLAEEAEDVEALLTQYDLFGKTCPDFLKFDCTMLMKLVKTARTSFKTKTQSDPVPTPHPPELQTVSMNSLNGVG